MTSDFIGDKIAVIKSYDDGVTKVLKNLKKNNLEIVTKEHNKEILKRRYISPKERQEIIDELISK